MILPTNRLREILPGTMMILASAYGLVFMCASCESASPVVTRTLGFAGVVVGAICMSAGSRPITSKLEGGAVVMAAVAAPVLISTLLRHAMCWPCMVFWLAMAAHIALNVTQRHLRWGMLLIPGGLAALAIAGLRLDSVASNELDNLLFRLRPAAQKPELYPVGWEMHQDLPLADHSWNIVWTNCAPCARGTALDAYRRLKKDHPGVRFLVANQALNLIPEEERETWVLAVEDYVEGLGVDPHGPPIYVEIKNRKVESIGYLTEYVSRPAGNP